MPPKKPTYKPFKDIPGVKYPEPKDEASRRGRKSADESTISYDQQKWILTIDAAKMFDCTASAVRIRLHKKKVKAVKVKVGTIVQMAWDREATQAAYDEFAKNRVSADEEGYLSTSEACEILGVGRSTLCRYAEEGMFSKLTCKGTDNGGRTVVLFDAAEIYNAKVDLQRIRELTAEINAIRDRLCKRK